MPVLLRRLARLVLVLAGLLLIGLAVLHLPAVRGRVLDRVRGYAERDYGVVLHASSLGYNLFSRSIELRDLSVASTAAGDPFLQAEHAVVVFGPGLFRGRAIVDRISLTRPRVTLVRYADGTVNLPPSRNGAQQTTPLQLGTVSVTALIARLDDRLAQRSFSVGPFDLSVDTGATSSGPGRFGPGEFTVRAGDIQTSGTIAGRLAFDGSRVRVDELTAETREGRIVLAGWADVIGERPAVSSRISATVDLPRTARLARVDAHGLSGRLEFTIDVSGVLAAPTITLAVSSRDAAYAPVGSVRLSGRSSFAANRVVIDALDINSAAGVLHAEGDIALNEAPSRMAVRWSNLRIDDLVQLFGHSLPMRSGSLASGSGTLHFDTRDYDARAWSRLRAVATTTVQPVANTSRSDALALSGNADLQLDRGRWSLGHSIQARRAQAVLSGNMTGHLVDSEDPLRSTLSGRSRLRVADIGALAPLMQSVGVTLPRDAIQGLAGSMLATVDLAGTLEKPIARIDLAARDVRTGLLQHPGALDARMSLDASGVRVQQAQAVTGTTSLQAVGHYSWRGPFDAHAELTQGDVSEIANRFGVPVTVTGSAHLDGTISGAPSNAQAVVALTTRDLAVEQVAVGAVTAKGMLKLVDEGPMTFDVAAPDVGARAQFEILNRAGYPVSGEITLEHDEVGALIPPRYRQQVGDLSGKLSATARGSGHLSDPTGLRGRVDLRSLDVMARGTRLVLAAPGAITVAEDRLSTESVDLRVGERTRVTLGGQLGATAPTEPLRFHLDGPIAELIDIGSRTALVAPVAVRGDGTATLDVTVEGTLHHPQPRGNLVVRSPSLAYGTLSPVTSVALDATIDPTLITLRTLTAQWQGTSVGAQGTLPWRVVVSSFDGAHERTEQSSRLATWLGALPPEPARATLTVRADNVTQAALKDLVATERLQEISGNASVTVAADTDRLSLDRVRATAVFDPASVTLAGVPFTQSVPTRLRLESGHVRIDDFKWTAAGNSIVASGGANLTAAQPSIELGVAGVLDLRAVGAFATGVGTGGTANVDLTMTGLANNPDIGGRITIADGELQVDSPRLAVSDLEGTLQIAEGRKLTVSLAGMANTGNATLDGTIDLADLAAPLGKLQFTGRGVAMEYPSGLQTESNVDLDLALGATSSTLGGRIDVLGGTYGEALGLSSQLLNLSSKSGIARSAPPPDWMSRLRLNVLVATTTDVHIDNNYGRLDVGGSFRLIGTAASPGVVGRLQAADDGEIFLAGNTYRIERLAVDLTNPRTIAPEVNFAAQTRIGDAPIRVELRCPATGPCDRKVTSLASNIDDKEAEARLLGTAGGAASAGQGVARLLSGEVLGVLSRSVGLDTLRLEQGAERRDIFDDPTLISGDVDPAARLTLAKRLGSNVELAFSQNLADDGFTWITSYLGPYGLSWRVLVLDDQSRSYEFRHEPPIGAARTLRRPRPPGPRIDAVTIVGATGFPEREIRKQLRLTEGDRFSFSAWQRDRDRLERFYHSQGFLEARIRARRLAAERIDSQGYNGSGKPADDRILLEYAITRGSATQLIINGAALPNAVRDRIVGHWATALFDGFLERDARAIVREHLYREGYLHATVTAAVASSASRDVKTLTVDVVPGSIVPSRIDFNGNSALPTGQLLSVVSTVDPVAAWLDPGSVKRLLEDHYRSEGFLAANVSVGSPETRNGTSVITIDVVEGSPYSVGQIEISGITGVPEQDAREALATSTGDRYRPANVAEGVERVNLRLRQASYLAASVDVGTRVDAAAARVDVAVRVTPGPRSILRDVVVQGGDPKKPLVARAIALEADAPLDPAAITETRRRLYDLDVYRSVDIEVQPLAAAATEPLDRTRLEQDVVARIALEERPRYRLRYGLALSDESVGPDERDRRLGFAADFENRNIFGRGATAGLSLRLRSDQQVGRVTLGSRRLFTLPIRSTVFIERSREQLNPEGAFPITSDITSLTGEQAYRVRRTIELRYGYGIERNHTFIRSEDAPFDLIVQLARLTTSGLIDRRNDAFDPARGWFVASTLELSRPGLGSDLSFLKDFAQYSHFVPIGSKVVLASAARLGLARTFDDELLIPTERFFAGGATSVRGYREDDLGPRSIFDDADGGYGLLVLNSEVRFPVYRWLKAVAFADFGNVFPKVSEISFSDLQIGIGAGARFDTPFGLIRLDLGIPANRRSFDPRWRIHIGLGHAF